MRVEAPSDEGSLAVDTDDVPDGTYPLTLRVTDAAANQRVVHAPAFVQTANADRTSIARGFDGHARLAVRFAGSSRSTVTVPYSRRATVRGRLSPGVPTRSRPCGDRRAATAGSRGCPGGAVCSAVRCPSAARGCGCARERGYAWAPFASVLADRRGHCSGSYRLRAHRPGVALQFRVVVPAQRGYPYLDYRGRPVTLGVR